MLFKNALAKLPRVERRAVEAKLALLGQTSLGGQAVINFYAELLMHDYEWQAMLKALVSANLDPSDLQSAIRAVMRIRKLKGQSATQASTIILGRAVTQRGLASTFHAEGYFASPSAAFSHVRSMKTKSLARLRNRWKAYKLGRFVMWSAFDPAGGTPFATLPTQAADVAAILGLREDTNGQPLLLLQYVLTPGVVPRIPRITEAYAADPWLYYFRPAGPADKNRGHGRTYVWPSHASSHAGVPEIVHEPVTGDCLVSGIQELL